MTPRKTTESNASESKTVTVPTTAKGWVSFVGSGPGDPGLLTVRAVELLRQAAVVITETPDHEGLVRSLLLDGDEPAFVDGGFGEDGQPLTHAARAKVVVREAKKGVAVVRLMAGDPFVFASAPEEAQACAKAGIGFEIVPGVSSMSAVPAYAGVPLTAKNAREIAVVTCTDKVDWSRYTHACTLVLLSGLGTLAASAKDLIAAGRAADTPVAVTSVGTSAEQRTVVGTLETIAAEVRAARLEPPAVIVVGEVVEHREVLSWFETKPLFGWRVLVPRTKEQAGVVSARLRGYGAVPEEVPTISVEPPRNPVQMDKAVRGLVEGRYEWIAFTSVNASRRCARSSRSMAWTPARSPASSSPRSVTRPPRRSRPGACAPT
jgi:uroporphyrinogen III methyltransferase/synthase